MAIEFKFFADRGIHDRLVSYLSVAAGMTLCYAFMRGSTWHGSAALHTLMEVAATLLALIVGAMALVRFYSKRNNTFLFVGAGFLGTAFLDGYHAVVTSVSFQPLMPSDLPALIPWSWIASRLFLSVFLFLSWLAWWRETQNEKSGQLSDKMVYLFSGIFTILSFLFFAFAPLPPAYYPDFIFHRPEEFLPALFFLMALIGYFYKDKWRHDIFEHWLMISLTISFVSQTVFMSFSGGLFDFEFDAAHLLKKLSYICVLTGLLGSMYAVFRQETEHRKALASSNEKLQKANVELERFAFIASHDLQEPLRKIETCSEILKNELKDKLDDDNREVLDIMVRGSKRMRRLVTDILSYSRLVSKKDAIEPVNLNILVRSVVTDLEIFIEKNNANVVFDDLPDLLGNEVQLGIVFQNLIVNGIKFNESEVPVVTIRSEQVEGFWKISVGDNGIGIDVKYQKNIFNMFERLHSKNEYAGTGIGLAMVRKVVEQYGGKIQVDSDPLEEGETTVFSLFLPRINKRVRL